MRTSICIAVALLGSTSIAHAGKRPLAVGQSLVVTKGVIGVVIESHSVKTISLSDSGKTTSYSIGSRRVEKVSIFERKLSIIGEDPPRVALATIEKGIQWVKPLNFPDVWQESFILGAHLIVIGRHYLVSFSDKGVQEWSMKLIMPIDHASILKGRTLLYISGGIAHLVDVQSGREIGVIPTLLGKADSWKDTIVVADTELISAFSIEGGFKDWRKKVSSLQPISVVSSGVLSAITWRRMDSEKVGTRVQILKSEDGSEILNTAAKGVVIEGCGDELSSSFLVAGDSRVSIQLLNFGTKREGLRWTQNLNSLGSVACYKDSIFVTDRNLLIEFDIQTGKRSRSWALTFAQ